jgi:hypothetical protein
MTYEEIQKAVNEISKMLTDRGVGHHACSIDIKANESPCFYIGCHDKIFGGLNSKFIIGESPQDVFEETKAFVMALPNKEDGNKQAFMADLASVIDKGKDLGIDVEFLNPLVEQVRALSENIITDKRVQ